MSGLPLQGPTTSGRIVPGHRPCILSHRLPTSCRLIDGARLSGHSRFEGSRGGNLNTGCAQLCNSKLKRKAIKTRCRPSAALLVDDVETVDITDSDMLQLTDSSGADALVNNTLAIQQLSDDLQRQMNALSAYTVCLLLQVYTQPC